MSELMEGWSPIRNAIKRSGSIAFDMYDGVDGIESGW